MVVTGIYRHLHVLQDIHLISITCALMIGTLLKLL